MKTAFRIGGICGLAVLWAASVRSQGFAQANPAAPSGQPSGLSSKLTPTGMAANAGSLANGVYSNSTYRFSLQVPPGWAVVPPTAERAKAAAPRTTASHPSNRVLLVMTENAPFRKSTERKALQIIATRLATAPGPTAAEGFITYSERTAKEQGLPVKYQHSPERLTIHDQPFSKATLIQTTDGADQHIEQYVTTAGESLLQFILISPTAEGLKDLQPTIQSLEFRPGEAARSSKRTKKK